MSKGESDTVSIFEQDVSIANKTFSMPQALSPGKLESKLFLKVQGSVAAFSGHG